MLSARRLASFVFASAFLSLPSVATAQACSATAGNLIQNCSFEDVGQYGAGQYYPNATVPGWGATPSGVRELWVGGPFEGILSQQGNAHVELNVTATGQSLWQQVALTVGESYTLTFWGLNRPNGGSSSQIDVFLGAGLGNPVLFSTGLLGGDALWREFSTTFVASSALTTVNFIGRGNGDSYGNHLDNVSLVSTVPEPSTYALMGAGLAALGVVARRRRRVVV